MARLPVLLDHDGGVDDFLTTILLLTMDHVETVGIVVTPGDCYAAPAVSATRKILDLMGHSEVPVAESTVRGLNPFPRLWRRHSFSVDLLPILNEREEIGAPLVHESGQRFMVRVLREAVEPVTLLVTGPLTTVALAMAMAPEIESKIRAIVWMGGALNVPGNVSPLMEGGQDGSAEWNVYWDPPAAERVWRSAIPIVMCPLDITNHVPVTPEFIVQLSRQRHHPLSDLAGQCYALVAHQDAYFWDVLTTAYLGIPDAFTLAEWETSVVVSGPSQGRTQVQPGGRPIQALDTVDLDRFYSYVLEQWAR